SNQTLSNIKYITKSELMRLGGQGVKFDAIMLGGMLSQTQYPHDKYKLLVSNFAAKGCAFLCVTPYGSIGMSDRECTRQSWSFDLDDLQHLFGGFSEFGAAFAPLYLGGRGEKL